MTPPSALPKLFCYLARSPRQSRLRSAPHKEEQNMRETLDTLRRCLILHDENYTFLLCCLSRGMPAKAVSKAAEPKNPGLNRLFFRGKGQAFLRKLPETVDPLQKSGLGADCRYPVHRSNPLLLLMERQFPNVNLHRRQCDPESHERL